jgi:hypothetical protein
MKWWSRKLILPLANISFGLIALTPLTGWSLGRVLWGSEITLFNPVTQNRQGTNRVIKRMREHLVSNQPEGEKFVEDFYIDEDPETFDFDGVKPGEAPGKAASPEEMNSLTIGRFSSPEGWYFDWGLDDGVIEIKMKDELANYKRFKDNMQDAIFASAANEGLFAPLYLGGGHLNLGMEAFEGNDLLLRNFLVDMFNHNELFLGVMNHDTNNAASLCVQAKKVQSRVESVITMFDKGGFTGKTSQEKFLAALQKAMNSESDTCFREWERLKEQSGEEEDDLFDGKRSSYFAVNFSHISHGEDYSRIEIRAVRAQASMDVFVHQIELFTKRLEMLEKKNRPIPFKIRVPVAKIDVKKAKHHLNPPVDPQAAMRSFYDYVTEAGLPWSEHREYLWPSWVFEGDLAKFEKSSWFLRRERYAPSSTKSCEPALAGGI